MISGDLRTLHAAPKGIYRRYVTFGYGECGKGGHAGGRGAQRVRPVSYTHLDVYKRQHEMLGDFSADKYLNLENLQKSS